MVGMEDISTSSSSLLLVSNILGELRFRLPGDFARAISFAPIGPSEHLGVRQQVFLDSIEFEHFRFSRKSP
jgi:hypothetical protein